MFGLFRNKKKAGEEVVAPATGMLMPLDDVTDDVFSQKMMGDGFAVIPATGEVTALIRKKMRL